MVTKHSIRNGVALPFGAYAFENGVNFSLFSRNATRVRLEFFDHQEDKIPSQFFDFDATHNRTGDVWHIWIGNVQSGQLYAYRVDGPYNPKEGHRFNFNKLLLDPYATAISSCKNWDFQKARGYDLSNNDLPSKIDNADTTPKCIFTHDDFDWKNDPLLKHPWSNMVIYETHVRGLTIHPSSGVSHAGTYRGLIEKIPYLTELGVTAVELMPIHEFNEFDTSISKIKTAQPLKHYWGYNSVSFFAPNGSYSSSGSLGQQKQEFKEMVRALHQAGIEVILDVVYNHTAEGDEFGPTVSFRGIDNTIFYMLEDDKRRYKNYAGTGNTINADHPVVRDHILDSLRYWVMEMHVDGFRFDLASILGLSKSGQMLSDAPLLNRIAEDPILREVKIIAEAWAIAGAYNIEKFFELRWSEWNGQYRDDVRCFWRGDDGMLGKLASRLCGSADLFAASCKGPENSINFITCHDGFTLNDLVSYRQKHNEKNEQNNADGAEENHSANYGIEGETENAAINSIRNRQIKNFLLTLFVSRGVPMLLGGDEFRRTQQGNNNAYCQDNEISWYDWTLLKRHTDIHHFTQKIIAFRKQHSVLSKEKFYTNSEIQWFNAEGVAPNWNNPKAKQLACLIYEDDVSSRGSTAGSMLYLMFNASANAADFVLPKLPTKFRWHLAFDTSHELQNKSEDKVLENLKTYHLENHSSAILLCLPVT